jgi:RNase adapter protein RapZ
VEQSSLPLVVIVTGLSGAGLSTAIKALEDAGFYCIDNLPFGLLDQALALIKSGTINARGFAFGMDARGSQFLPHFEEIRAQLSQQVRLDIVFLKAETEVIVNRYSSTRRRHPLLVGSETLAEAISKEQAFLEPLEQRAHVVLDTSDWSPHHLARIFEQRYFDEMEGRILHVTFVSFGFKHGMLRPAESIFDVRFITNPYFVARLREKSGLDAEVAEYIWADSKAVQLFERLSNLFDYLLPNYYGEGKNYLRVGIGCTGGQHRSVFFANRLVEHFNSRPIPHVEVACAHRDLLINQAK